MDLGGVGVVSIRARQASVLPSTSRQDSHATKRIKVYLINKVATMEAQSEYIQYNWLGYCIITYTLFVWTICTAATRQNGCQYRKGPPHSMTNKQHSRSQLTSSDTSQPMAPGQHSSVLSIASQLVKTSQEYSITSSDRFRPLAPSRCATNRIKVSNQWSSCDKSPD